jgi:hypothetical protein
MKEVSFSHSCSLAISVLNCTCVEFSLCVIKQYTMKTNEEIHESLTSALDRGGQPHALTALLSGAHSI